MNFWKYFGPPASLVTIVLVSFATIACGSAPAAGGDSDVVAAPAPATTEQAADQSASDTAPPKRVRDTEADTTASPAVDLPSADFAGLYQGAILYRPGSTELEILVELGATAGGELAGTLDMPAYPDVTFKPLENFRVEGREISFSYRHDSEIRGPDALFAFEGELSADGQTLSGEFLETRGRIPFELQRIGDPGAPRPELIPQPVTDLSAGAAELRDAFNAHPDHARLVILLSPT